MRRIVAPGVLVLVVTLALPVPGFCAQGDLLWSRQYGRETTGDYTRDVAAAGGRVFQCGGTSTVIGGGAFSVRAHSALTGSLLWQDHFDREGAEFDLALALATDGVRVFAGGYTTTAAGGSSFTVRAYDAASGALVWDSSFDRQDSGADWVQDLLVADGRVFAVGSAAAEFVGNSFTIRAYDAATGAVLWTRYHDQSVNRFDGAAAVAFADGRVFAAGHGTATDQTRVALLRAYAAADGTFLWGDSYASPAGDLNVTGVAAGEGKVFLSGNAGEYALLRTHHAADGGLNWIDLRGEIGGQAVFTDVQYARGRAYVCGRFSPGGGGSRYEVRAYAHDSSVPLWTRGYEPAGSDTFDNIPLRLLVTGRRVVAVGMTHRPGPELAHTVRVYTTGGRRAWMRRWSKGDYSSSATAVAALGGRIFVGGTTSTADTGGDMTLKAYQLR